MRCKPRRSPSCVVILVLALVSLSGCQNLKCWWKNDLKVGPNYHAPPSPVADDFRDSASARADSTRTSASEWWHLFGDPELDRLVQQAYNQNLSLKAAAWRISEARSLRRIAAANLLPQNQAAFGQYAHTQNSQTAGTAFPGFPITIDDWSTGFDVGWELDVWGRIRRNVAAADAQVSAAVKDYDFAVVSLLGEVASVYIQIRSIDERLQLAKKNVQLQRGSLKVASARFEEGREAKLDVVQAEANLAATQSLIPQLELARRQSSNALAVLLGVPPSDAGLLAPGQLPNVPNEVIVGIPAQLLTRRPDIRSAERLMAAQFEQIGIVQAELYPTFSLGGTLGLQSAKLSTLFDGRSFTGTIAPAFRWNILNYGRLKESIRVEEARFQQIQWDFQSTVLSAQREVEDGIVEFIKLNEQYEYSAKQASAIAEAVELGIALYKEGKQDFGRVFVVESSLVQTQDQLVALKANIAIALIKTYKALGGGWEVRCNGGPTLPNEFTGIDNSIPSPDVYFPGLIEEAVPLSANSEVDSSLEASLKPSG